MKSFKTYFEQVLDRETVGILPGGFKPPTNGHALALEELLKTCDRGVVFIGKSERDGITQEMSYQIWSIYAPYISKPIEVIKSPITPVRSTYEFADSHSGINIIVGAGAKDSDIDRYQYFSKNPEKYPNVIIQKIEIQGGGISGTQTREMIQAKDPSVIDYFVPSHIKETDKERIKSILGIA